MNFPDAVSELIRRRKLILLNILVFTLLAVVVSLLLPHRYAATARLLPPPDDDPLGLTAQLGVGLTGQLGRLRASMMGGGAASDLMVGILSSNTVMESVAIQCSIVDRYRVKDGNLHEAVRKLEQMTDLSVGDEGIVNIAVETRRPKWAAEIANAYARHLDEFLRTSNINRGKNMRIFTEGRLEEVRRELDSAQAELVAYQVTHGLTAVEEQLAGVVSSYSQLYSLYLQKQTQLRLMEETSSPENPLLVSLRADVAAYQRQLQHLLAGDEQAHTGGVFDMAFDSLPVVVSEYVRRVGKLTLIQEAYSMLYQQYEHSRIMEARDTPTITILDHAIPPDKRSFPRRALIVLTVFAFSFAMSICYVLGSKMVRRLPESHPESADSWWKLNDQLIQILGPVRRLFGRRKPKDQ